MESKLKLSFDSIINISIVNRKKPRKRVKEQSVMKYFGEHLEEPDEEIIVFPRKKKDIVFIVKGVSDLSGFNNLCPPPEAPRVILPGGKFKLDTEDRGYQFQVLQWASKKHNWMMVSSLRDTPGLEWEKVKMSEPETWALWQVELTESGFNDNELMRLANAMANVNGLNDARIQEATQRFLATRELHQNGQSSQTVEVPPTPSGEPVNDSESNLQTLQESAAGQS